MSQDAVRIREVDAGDMEDIFNWRNHPEARKNSFNQKPLVWEEHVSWFNKKINDASTSIYIACLGDVKIGSIRFDDDGQVIRVSVMLNPEFMGKGLGAEVIKAATRSFLEEKKTRKPLVAEIKKDNIASIKAFEKAGFEENFRMFVFKEGRRG